MASGLSPASDASEFSNAYAKLKALVLANQFAPNEHLQANYLAERLAVGVTPAREALIRLSVEDLIIGHAKRGFFAKVLTVNELCQLYHLALSLLIYNIRWDGGRRSASIAAPDIACAVNATQINRSAVVLAIEQLHEHIATMNGNAQVAKVIRNYNSRTHAARQVYAGQIEKAESMVAYIRTMLPLLERDDREAPVAELSWAFGAKIANASEVIKELAAQACSADWTNHHFGPTDFARTQNGVPQAAG